MRCNGKMAADTGRFSTRETGLVQGSKHFFDPLVPVEKHALLATAIDREGDGRQDLLIPIDAAGGPKWRILRSRGDGTFTQEDAGIPFDKALTDEGVKLADPYGPRVLDVDGDGAHDVIAPLVGTFHVFRNRAKHPDVLVGITDGLNPHRPGESGHRSSVAISYGTLVVECIGDVLEEHEPEHDVLVLGRVHVVPHLVGGLEELPLEPEIPAAIAGFLVRLLGRSAPRRAAGLLLGLRGGRVLGGGVEERGLRGPLAEDAGDDRRLVPAAVVEAEGAAELFQAVAGEVGEDGVELRRARMGDGLDELVLDATIADDEVELLDDGAELVVGEVDEDFTGGGYLGRTRVAQMGGGWEGGIRGDVLASRFSMFSSLVFGTVNCNASMCPTNASNSTLQLRTVSVWVSAHPHVGRVDGSRWKVVLIFLTDPRYQRMPVSGFGRWRSEQNRGATLVQGSMVVVVGSVGGDRLCGRRMAAGRGRAARGSFPGRERRAFPLEDAARARGRVAVHGRRRGIDGAARGVSGAGVVVSIHEPGVSSGELGRRRFRWRWAARGHRIEPGQDVPLG